MSNAADRSQRILDDENTTTHVYVCVYGNGLNAMKAIEAGKFYYFKAHERYRNMVTVVIEARHGWTIATIVGVEKSYAAIKAEVADTEMRWIISEVEDDKYWVMKGLEEDAEREATDGTTTVLE